MQPVRKIGKSHWAINGTLPSWKAVGPAQFESTLERDFYLLLEFDPAVTKFITQPVKLVYRMPNKSRRSYTPDTLVFYSDGRLPGLFEVKYADELAQKGAELEPRFEAARLHAAGQGWTFEVITEERLRGQLLKNAQFLLPFMWRSMDPQKVQQLSSLVLARTSPEALLARFPPAERGEWLPVLWHLVAVRAIKCDLDAPLGMQMEIWS